MTGVELTVEKMHITSDSGRGWARLDGDAMSRLGVSIRDVIEIKGRRSTAAIVVMAYRPDRGENIIRIDTFIRKNAGVSVGEKVRVRKAKAKDAKEIIFRYSGSAGLFPKVCSDVEVKKSLLERSIAMVEGDIVPMTIGSISEKTPMVVDYTKPKGIVRVVDSTNVTLQRRRALNQ
jgi:transitional endoplasmic reticulum ATPase